MNRYTYTHVILLLIVRVYATIDTKRGVRTRVQFRVQSGIFGDGEQVQGLGIDPYPVDMQIFDACGHDIVPDRQVPAPEKGTALHGIGIKDGRVTEIGALFQQRRLRSGIGDTGCRIIDIGRCSRAIDQRGRMQCYLLANLVAK